MFTIIVAVIVPLVALALLVWAVWEARRPNEAMKEYHG